ncbi:MAG: hypothetical protein ACRDHZ_00445 [Ktedonobacteraceae bacterium]
MAAVQQQRRSRRQQRQANPSVNDPNDPMEALQPKPQQVSNARHQNWSENWPAWGYLVAGGIALTVWLAGTAVQVQTSEAWIAQVAVTDLLAPHFSIYGQLTAFWDGGLNQKQLVAYIFGWSVQAALILSSLSIDLPQHTVGAQRRSALFTWACAGLILINSMGDWYYSQGFGFWGQLGFTFALFITTFCFGYVAIWAIHRAIRAFRNQH